MIPTDNVLDNLYIKLRKIFTLMNDDIAYCMRLWSTRFSCFFLKKKNKKKINFMRRDIFMNCEIPFYSLLNCMDMIHNTIIDYKTKH